jgi:hypothetical protein
MSNYLYGMVIVTMYVLGWLISYPEWAVGYVGVAIQVFALCYATATIAYSNFKHNFKPGWFTGFCYIAACMWLIVGDGIIFRGVFPAIAIIGALVLGNIVAYFIGLMIAWGFQAHIRHGAPSVPTIPISFRS